MSKISLYPEGKINKDGKLAPAVIPFTNIEFDEYLIKTFSRTKRKLT